MKKPLKRPRKGYVAISQTHALAYYYQLRNRAQTDAADGYPVIDLSKVPDAAFVRPEKKK